LTAVAPPLKLGRMRRAFGTLALVALAGCRAGEPPPAVAPAPTSLLLVTIDTLRADRLGTYGDSRARTPTIDRLAREGTLFEQAFTVAPITLPAHASLMTGRLPPEHGVRGNVGFTLPADIPTLAEAFQKRGATTAAFVGGFPLARGTGLERGFAMYDDAFGRAEGLHYEFSERRAHMVVTSALTWLTAQRGPVFLWVHFFDPHAPYAPPPSFRDPDPYRGEVAACDAALAHLLAVWEAGPEPSIIAVVSDHGEAFGEHGEASHSLFVYDTTLRVPLILRGPGVPAGRRVRGAVSTADLPATLLARFQTPFRGQDLLALPGDPVSAGPLYAETLAPRLEFGWSDLRAWRKGRFKLIRAPRPELYDLAADPEEQRDLARVDPRQLAELERELQAWLPTTELEHRSAVAPEAEERLRSLGYTQAPATRGSAADPKDKRELARRIAAATGPFKDYAEAARVYKQLQRLDPPNPLVNLRLADALLRSGQAQASLVPYRRVLDAGARTADPFVGLATALLELGRLDEAGRVLGSGLEVAPRSGQLNYNLGELARARGDQAEARRLYALAAEDAVTSERARARLELLR